MNVSVLAGVDAASTYCYLLAAADHRDADTWGVHLLDACAQGFNPQHTIADAGQGLRAEHSKWLCPARPARFEEGDRGVKPGLPGVECQTHGRIASESWLKREITTGKGKTRKISVYLPIF